MTPPFAERVAATMRSIQENIVEELARLDGGAFCRDDWNYDKGRGGGRTRVIADGGVFEKGGINFSAIGGDRLPAAAAADGGGAPFFATGVSLVLHPRNPYIPTVHMNVRYFESGERWWFGGGADLTPNYPQAEDAAHFHRTLKRVCDAFDPGYYPRFKAECDRYFTLPHRGEMRGVGGIFFDHKHDDRDRDFEWTAAVGRAFLSAYVPIVERNRRRPYGERERAWQQIRRGRYVEFNLVYDRGTRFGLESGGRTESILMSLPPLAHWIYDHHPEPGSPEADLLENYLQPRDWA